jgi:hypothetical protein
MGASRSSDANSLDLLGESGGADLGGITAVAPPSQIDATRAKQLKDRWLENQGLDPSGNQLPAYGTPKSQGGTATGYAVMPDHPGSHVIDWAPLDDNDQLAAGTNVNQTVVNTGGAPGAASPTGTVGTVDLGDNGLSNAAGWTDPAASGIGGNPSTGNGLSNLGARPSTGNVSSPDALTDAKNQATNARSLGLDVLQGNEALVDPTGAARQQDALSQAMSFMNGPKAADKAIKATNAFQKGPKAANDVLGDLTAFTQQPEGPSQAEIQLQQQSGKNMADALSLARSGRARDAGSQARALNVAQTENAQTNADTNQQAALLRANETATARGQNLQALGQKAGLAQGLDQNTLQALQLSGSLSQGLDQNQLQALGLTGDLATQMRNAGLTERGQNLNFAQGQEQIGAGLTGDALKAIPQLEQVRHSDQFDLTPEQRIAIAKLQATSGKQDPNTLDTLIGVGKDILPLL